jgi:hypothetical protein
MALLIMDDKPVSVILDEAVLVSRVLKEAGHVTMAGTVDAVVRLARDLVHGEELRRGSAEQAEMMERLARVKS